MPRAIRPRTSSAAMSARAQTVLIEDGKPILGIWQGVYFCEFDGPRHRRYYIKVMADN